MRFKRVPLRAASIVMILGTTLVAALGSAPAQAGSVGGGHRLSSVPVSSVPGVITGVVDGAGGQPLTAACVFASGPGGGVLAVTHSDGRYVLSGLSPGRYTLRYSTCTTGGGYVHQLAGVTSLPDRTVTLTSGQQRELSPVTLRATPPVLPAAPSLPMAGLGALGGLSAQMTRPASRVGSGAIAGTVTGRGKPLENICVLAFGPSFGRAFTSKTGQFRVGKLKSGRYEVLFSANECGKAAGNWLEQLYKGVAGPPFTGKPTFVSVSAHKTTGGIDAALRLGGEISGTVRSRGGKVVSRVCVEASARVGRSFFFGGAESGKNGRYALHSLRPGRYVIVFLPRDCGSTGNYVPQWWRDSATEGHATKILITPGRIVREVNAALGPGAILSGVVRAGSPHGPALKDICVDVEPIRPSEPYANFVRVVTAKDGSYRLTGLTTGRYQLYFTRGCGNNGNYLQTERSVSVVAGRTTAGFNASLPIGAIITGTVTGGHGRPVGGICVTVSGARSFGGTKTAADGDYSIDALESGRYTVSFSGGCGNAGSYAPQFYHGQVNVASADPVTATAGHTTRGIGAALQPGGTITGQVTDSSGNRLNRICVQVENPSEAAFGFPLYLQDTKNGVFTATNLVPGVYVVNFGCFFFGSPFASQWFRGQPGQGTADWVSAPAGVVTSGISAVMRRGGFISGVVKNSAGIGVSGVCVQVVPHSSASAQVSGLNQEITFTRSHGTYRIGPLGATKYDVQFGCDGHRYASQWYRGSAARASAMPVAVTTNSTTTGINAVMTAGGSISGEVTTRAGNPQARVCVSAYSAADVSSGAAVTSNDGRYTIEDLSSGTYQLTYSDCGFGKHHVVLGTATRLGVKVAAPRAVTGINEKLFPAGSISGTVLGGPGATRQAGVCVVAVPVSQNAGSGSLQTSPDGTYRLTGLAPGIYKVYFGDPFCLFAGNGYAPQWYKGKASQAAATDVNVPAGGKITGVGATLGADGTISGTVTGGSRKPVAGECVTAVPVAPVPDPLFGSVPDPVVAVSQANGAYTLADLQPGKYLAEFSVGCGDSGFRTQWWHNSSSAEKATVITISANATVTGIDAALRG
jgi:phage gp45-like